MIDLTKLERYDYSTHFYLDNKRGSWVKYDDVVKMLATEPSSSDKPNGQKDACSARLDAVLADYGRGGDSLPYNHQRIERLARQYASALDEIALVLDVPDNHAADLDEIAAIVRRTQ